MQSKTTFKSIQPHAAAGVCSHSSHCRVRYSNRTPQSPMPEMLIAVQHQQRCKCCFSPQKSQNAVGKVQQHCSLQRSIVMIENQKNPLKLWQDSNLRRKKVKHTTSSKIVSYFSETDPQVFH